MYEPSNIFELSFQFLIKTWFMFQVLIPFFYLLLSIKAKKLAIISIMVLSR